MYPFEPAEREMPICTCGRETNWFYVISGEGVLGCPDCIKRRYLDEGESGCEFCRSEKQDAYFYDGSKFKGCDDCIKLVCAHEYMEEHGENLRCLAGDMRFEEARDMCG